MIARDQYGQTIRLAGHHPRKELLAYLGRKHAERIYRDTRDGRTLHVGYIIAGSWWTLYAPVEVPA